MGSADSLAPKLSAVSPVLPDFLPLKCDACEQIFCTDHITYSEHRCTSAYKKDVQVPVCPLCSTPIPVKRGEMPDVAVGEHIDRDCRSDPAQRKRKIFTNKCLKAGCKQREMMKLICDQCHGNFCLKHRHPLDHNCSAAGPPLSKAGHAAVARVQTPSSMAAGTSSRPAAAPPAPVPGRGGVTAAWPAGSSLPPVVALQDGLSEDEALRRALELSLAESAHGSAQLLSSVQEEEEALALAQALSASEEEYRRRQQQQAHSRSSRPSDCSML
uniref:Zinc finger AN1-type containing 2B n=1 Tax=Pelusios castaneus TaxID=367368 RepID=A0A8C8VN16_9SAUR